MKSVDPARFFFSFSTTTLYFPDRYAEHFALKKGSKIED